MVIYMGYWPSVRSRWRDIDQVLSSVFMDLAFNSDQNRAFEFELSLS